MEIKIITKESQTIYSKKSFEKVDSNLINPILYLNKTSKIKSNWISSWIINLITIIKTEVYKQKFQKFFEGLGYWLKAKQKTEIGYINVKKDEEIIWFIIIIK